MAISSYKGVNQVYDVVDSISSVESTTVYPRNVLIVKSDGSLAKGDGTTAGGTGLSLSSSVAWADITGKPSLITELSEDTSPQLGGTLDANGNDIHMGSGTRISKGSGADGALLLEAGTGYLGPDEGNTVLGAGKGLDIFLDVGNDDGGNAFTIWNNIDPYSASADQSNYKLKLNGDTGNLGIAGRVTANGGFLGDLRGSVFADDSTQIVDSVNTKVSATLVATTDTAPSASGDAGDVGEIRYDDNYIYIKTAGAGWKRAALSGLV